MAWPSRLHPRLASGAHSAHGPQADSLLKLTKAAGVEVESYWPGLFVKALADQDIDKLLTTVSSGGSGGGVAAGSAGADDAAEEKKEEKKESSSSEDMGGGGGMFDDDY